jgi:cell division protein FtsB
MIKRLALLIHWFGFLAGFIASLFLVTLAILQDTPPNTGIYEVLLVAFVAVIMPFLQLCLHG